jgi:polysaccharide biosynthesis protein PslH
MRDVDPQRSSGPARPRVLVCAPFPPHLEARHGGKATAQLLLRLAERNDIAVLTLRPAGGDRVDPAIAERCVYVEEVGTPAKGGFRRRLTWTLGLLHRRPPWATDCRSTDYARALKRLLDEWKPEIVEIHFQAMAQYVDLPGRRGLPTILVDYDPPSAWAVEMLRATSGPRRLVRWAEVAAWRHYEASTRSRFDAIVVFADRDLPHVAQGAGGASVIRIPLSVEVPPSALDPDGADPPTILFVGSFGHPPNVDAAIWLAGSIFPRVLERAPTARLDLVGHDPGEDVRALSGGAVSVHASVPDVNLYLDRAAVVAAPIRLGGSMRMKVLEALAAGKALVATPRAVEGVGAVPGEQYLVAEDEMALTEAMASLLLDRERRRALAENARAWAERNLGWTPGVEAFEQLYDRLTEEKNAARRL